MSARSTYPPLAAVLESIQQVVGRSHVVTDPDVLAGAVRDWTGRFVGSLAGGSWVPSRRRPLTVGRSPSSDDESIPG